MLGFWVLLHLAYLVAPIDQRPRVSLGGLMFHLLFLGTFASAALLGSTARVGDIHRQASSAPASLVFRDRRLIGVLALIGCIGALMSVADKISSAPAMLLADAASLRNERAQQLAGAETVESGGTSALAFLLYPAGYIAVFVGLLRYEQLATVQRTLTLAFIPLAFVQSVAAGGRSGIMVMLLMMGIAAYLRNRRRLPGWPRARGLRWLVRALLVFFVLYSSAIWVVRSEVSSVAGDLFLEHAETHWGVTAAPALKAFAEAIGAPGLVQSVLSTVFYFTQSLSITERMLDMPTVPTLLGGYHIDLAAAFLRALPEGRQFLGAGYDALLDANVYGFFTGAWSALYIDFGAPGAWLFTLAWGWFAGWSFQSLRRRGDDVSAALYGFALYSTLISFVSPPFGFSNSAMTFTWFLVFAALSRSRPLRAIRQRPQ